MNGPAVGRRGASEKRQEEGFRTTVKRKYEGGALQSAGFIVKRGLTGRPKIKRASSVFQKGCTTHLAAGYRNATQFPRMFDIRVAMGLKVVAMFLKTCRPTSRQRPDQAV